MTEPKSVADVLDAAADLLTPEGAWTQGALAKAADGEWVDSGLSPAASCWCLLGAVERGGGNPVWSAARRVIATALGVDEREGIPTWNDAPERTQPEVVAKLREAAALAREQGL